MTTATDAVFRISHVFKASRARVWAAWTTPDQLARWFGPKGTTGTLLDYDLRPGGSWFWRMDAEGAPPMYGRFVFRVVDAPDQLQWIHGFADEAGNRIRAPFPGDPWPLEMLTTVRFADHADGTQVTLEFEPFEASDGERDTFIANMPGMQAGWSGSFQQLEELLG